MNSRFRALETIRNRPAVPQIEKPAQLRELFRANVFDDATMRRALSREVYTQLKDSIDQGKSVARSTAGSVANAMKAWAIEKGATHYTHWFQPISGLAAEKHDSFLDFSGGEVIERFSGDELVQQEPDAHTLAGESSRSTFEARGLTAWDCSSPAFIFETRYGKTLCIPTIYVSYTGQALDYKIPLLKSIGRLDEAAVAVCQLFDKSVTRVIPTLGAEHEFFLVDSSLHDLRPDLLLTGRTLQGAPSARMHQFDHRYFGSIPERALAFFTELEIEALKLGIPLKTRHNEVAPGQFELALQYEELNVAVDHGQLLMDLLDRVARRHHLRALLHEKPFAGMSGSGKHNNWSISTDKGKNLLSPGANPKENLMFLAFFTSVIRAVAEHADLLRASVASAGNDLRLGTREAPPLIMSVFIGRLLSQILEDIEHPPRKSKKQPKNAYLKLGISKIPELLLDNTDRNRTAPFAFTGNKFEFRAVGASANSSHPMMVLNVIVAQQLTYFLDAVTKKVARSRKKELAILDMIRENIVESKRVRFEGDSHSDAWVKESEMRGLLGAAKTPEALDAYLSEKATSLFSESGIFSADELRTRHELLLQNYLQHIRTESGVLEEMVMGMVIPKALAYRRELLEVSVGETALTATAQLAAQLGAHIDSLWQAITDMKTAVGRAEDAPDTREVAVAYSLSVLPVLDQIREHADELEKLIPDESWSLPKYREILFLA